MINAVGGRRGRYGLLGADIHIEREGDEVNVLEFLQS